MCNALSTAYPPISSRFLSLTPPIFPLPLFQTRHSRGYGSRSALRNWQFQVSKDGHDWTTIHTHENDMSLCEPGVCFLLANVLIMSSSKRVCNERTSEGRMYWSTRKPNEIVIDASTRYPCLCSSTLQKVYAFIIKFTSRAFIIALCKLPHAFMIAPQFPLYYALLTQYVGTTATWPLDPPDDPEGWRHIRVKLTGPNASGQTHYMSLSGLELYGEIRGLADEDLGRVLHSTIAISAFPLVLWLGGERALYTPS